MAKLNRETFNFTQDFQDLILACILRRAEFSCYSPLISAKYFTGSVSTITARSIFQYHRKYDHFPSKETLIQIVSEEARKLSEVEESMATYVEKLFTIKIKDWKHVHEKIVVFCKERALLKAMKKGIDYFKKGEEPPGGYVKLFEDATRVGSEFTQLENLRFDPSVVINDSDNTYGYVQVDFNLYDEAGTQVGSTFANVNNLEPHGRWHFKAFVIEKTATNARLKGAWGS